MVATHIDDAGLHAAVAKTKMADSDDLAKAGELVKSDRAVAVAQVYATLAIAEGLRDLTATLNREL